eukprot:Skav203900  [mRNA]  locus=scaffold1649:266308:273573:- [translate_table: standard]
MELCKEPKLQRNVSQSAELGGSNCHKQLIHALQQSMAEQTQQAPSPAVQEEKIEALMGWEFMGPRATPTGQLKLIRSAWRPGKGSAPPEAAGHEEAPTDCNGVRSRSLRSASTFGRRSAGASSQKMLTEDAEEEGCAGNASRVIVGCGCSMSRDPSERRNEVKVQPGAPQELRFCPAAWWLKVHLLVLYAIAAYSIARSSNPAGDPRRCSSHGPQVIMAQANTSSLARQVQFADAWNTSEHSRFCCLIYATQNGWKLPIVFEEIGAPYDWCLVDFEKNEQKSEGFLKINPNGRIPALIDRESGVAVAESGAILEYVCEVLKSSLSAIFLSDPNFLGRLPDASSTGQPGRSTSFGVAGVVSCDCICCCRCDSELCCLVLLGLLPLCFCMRCSAQATCYHPEKLIFKGTCNASSGCIGR